MKTIALKINDTRIQWVVNLTIDQLASVASDCCEEAPEWTKCLGPIVDAWHFLKENWNRLVEAYHDNRNERAFNPPPFDLRSFY